MTSICHVVAMPYPSRGHINPMMNLCKSLLSTAAAGNQIILVTFVVTEKWFGFLAADPKPAEIRFATIPNVIPSELGRTDDFSDFVEAVNTKMEQPFERLLDQIKPAPRVIIADTHLLWAVQVGNRRNISVASLWTMSASMFSLLHHFELLVRHGHFPADLSERGDETVDYVPGILPSRLADLPFFHGVCQKVSHRDLEFVYQVPKSQYLLLTSIYDLEPEPIQTLTSVLSVPVFAVGPTIPYFNLPSVEDGRHEHDHEEQPHYLRWLDSQPECSVLYISLESFLSVSKLQMDEMVAGVRDSGVRFMWVSRGESSALGGGGGAGIVVPWCDQLRVLCHSAVGGFWSHCGWNSTVEAAFSGVPVLTCPILWDQFPNSKFLGEDLEMGWRVNEKREDGFVIPREEVAALVRRFMDVGSDEAAERRRRGKRVREKCRRAVERDGSAWINLKAFAEKVLERPPG